MDYLSREAILNVDDVEVEDVEVPEWGGKVRVRNVTGRDRDRFESSLVQQRGNTQVQNLDNMRAKLVVKAVIDPETGKRVFSDQDANALGQKSSAAVTKVFNVAARLSGISEDAVEDAMQDFDDAPNDGSTSA